MQLTIIFYSVLFVYCSSAFPYYFRRYVPGIDKIVDNIRIVQWFDYLKNIDIDDDIELHIVDNNINSRYAQSASLIRPSLSHYRRQQQLPAPLPSYGSVLSNTVMQTLSGTICGTRLPGDVSRRILRFNVTDEEKRQLQLMANRLDLSGAKQYVTNKISQLVWSEERKLQDYLTRQMLPPKSLIDRSTRWTNEQKQLFRQLRMNATNADTRSAIEQFIRQQVSLLPDKDQSLARKYMLEVIVGPNMPTVRNYDIFGYPTKPTSRNRIDLFRPLNLSADDDEQLRQLSDNIDIELIDQFLIDKINQFVRERANQMHSNLTQLLVPPQSLIDITDNFSDDERATIEMYRKSKNFSKISTLLESKLSINGTMVNDRKQSIDFIHRVLMPSLGCNSGNNIGKQTNN